jgi:hypothetical protein
LYISAGARNGAKTSIYKGAIRPYSLALDVMTLKIHLFHTSKRWIIATWEYD